MIVATIIAVGELKSPHWREAFLEYKKRIAPYAKIEMVEVPSSPFRTEADKERVKKEEGERIRRALRKKTKEPIFLLGENGKELNSREFAGLFEKGERVTFVTGGALGFESTLTEEYPILSLSRLTLPHELARVVLMEQLYRATTILGGKSYHY